jgi:hypothetical protein
MECRLTLHTHEKTMTALPEPTRSTAKEIVKLWDGRNTPHRPHMGCSIIGHSCDRYIWLTWRWAKAPSFPGRILRLFDTGKREEERLVQDLRDCGIEIFTTDGDSDKQIAVSAHNGHLAGSVDGIGRGFIEAPKTWAVLECKTHGSKSFAKLQKEGVKASKFQHYVQMQMYMGLLDLERAMYLAQNKDDDSIYSEWVHFDKDCFEQHMERAKALLEMTSPPQRLSEDPSWYECKWCDYYTLCHGEQIADVNCRTCAHSSPDVNGMWLCGNGNGTIDENIQRTGCLTHLYIPPLIPYAKPVDGGENFVEYEKADGTKFKNGPGHISSQELFVTLPSLVGDKVIEEIKETFPGAKVVSSKPFTVADLKDDLEPVYAPSKEKLTDEQKKIKAAVAALEKQRHTKYKD